MSRLLVVAAVVCASQVAWAYPSKSVPACVGPGPRCHARIPIGEIAMHSPDELEAMYHVDVSLGAGVTVAVVDAYGYPDLESDLAQYRSMFHLPPCTRANGCLRVVNLEGATSPLPQPGGGRNGTGWTIETALDVDMVSAGCPKCNILVVEADSPNGGLDAANSVAAQLGADTISNSWSSVEDPGGGDVVSENAFAHTGVGIFASTGDNGYAAGAQYPATSLHVIAVGGTHVQDHILSHTVTETAWSEAGSSCSMEFAAPPFQPTGAACPMRAASDVSGIADPQTGVAIYCTAAGGLSAIGGTSAASPLLAAIFAASGHPDADPGFVYRHPEAFTDVLAGSNGDCGTNLCVAGSGWDGPTGLGSPLQDVLAQIGTAAGPSVTITSPADGATVDGAFQVEATAGSGAAHVDLRIDGVRIAGLAAAPYTFAAPMLAPGPHTIVVSAFDPDHDTGSASVAIVVPAPPAPDAGVGGTNNDGGTSPTFSAGGGGGCASGGGSVGSIPIAAAFLAARRRRRASAARLS